MDSHPHPSDDLIAAALGELTGPEQARVESSLDETGRVLVQRLQAAVAVLSEVPLEQPPAALLSRLKALGRTTPLTEAVGHVAGTIRRFIATISFDSRVSPALAGFRGAAEGRQLVFTSPVGDVHLRLTGPSEGDPRITIRGCIEVAGAQTPPEAGAFARLGPPHAEPVSATTASVPDAGSIDGILDEDAMFVIRAQPGAYPLTVRLGQTEIDLGILDVA